MLISYQEQLFVLKSIQDFISSKLGLDPKKLEFPINLRHLSADGCNYFDLFFSEKGDELYLKFGDLDARSRIKKIEITRIMFRKQQSGYGTALLSILSEIADIYNYSEILIDSPNCNSEKFGEKLGFIKHNGTLKIRTQLSQRSPSARRSDGER